MTNARRRLLATGASGLLLLASAAPLSAQHGTGGGEWPYYGGDLGSTRYSPLDRIDRDNVAELEVEWRWSSRNLGPGPDYNFRATPIYVNGVLYTTAGSRRAAVALDPATGETLWMYRFDEGERGKSAPRKTSGRGVSHWTDGTEERIFFITPAYFMVALDARTGRPFPDFGRDGVVDLREDLDEAIDLETSTIGSSTPGIVIGDVIVVGAAFPSGGSPPTKEMPAGNIRGYDVRTGERLWIFHTIPHPGEFGHDTWEGRLVGVHRQRQRVDVDDGGPGARLRLSADGGARPATTTAATVRETTCSPRASSASTRARASACGTSRRCTTGSGTTTSPPRRCWPTSPSTAEPIRAVAQVTKQGFTFVFDRVTG